MEVVKVGLQTRNTRYIHCLNRGMVWSARSNRSVGQLNTFQARTAGPFDRNRPGLESHELAVLTQRKVK